MLATVAVGAVAVGCGAAPSAPTSTGTLGHARAVAPISSSAALTPSGHVADRPGMVLVPAGNYWTGCDKRSDIFCRTEDRSFAQVHLDDYLIDRYEVTVRDYARCVEAGACDATKLGGFEGWKDDEWRYCNWGKPGKEDHPLNCVSWTQADAFCRWSDKRLPTEAEWEKAARGTDKRAYPWGDEMISCEYAVTNEEGKATARGCGDQTTYPVGSKPKGVSPYGVHDIVGNVWEWTADKYEPPPGAKDVRPNERKGKGGCWGSGNPWNSRISWSHHYPEEYRSNVRLGFRCAADPAGTPALARRETSPRAASER